MSRHLCNKILKKEFSVKYYYSYIFHKVHSFGWSVWFLINCFKKSELVIIITIIICSRESFKKYIQTHFLHHFIQLIKNFERIFSKIKNTKQLVIQKKLKIEKTFKLFDWTKKYLEKRGLPCRRAPQIHRRCPRSLARTGDRCLAPAPGSRRRPDGPPVARTAASRSRSRVRKCPRSLV